MRKSVSNSCSVCCEARKSRSREFSAHAWTALTMWGEVEQRTFGQPICEGCYREFRDLLIERSEELHAMPMTQPDFASVLEMPFMNKETPAAQIAS
jgi:hypothetical protein